MSMRTLLILFLAPTVSVTGFAGLRLGTPTELELDPIRIAPTAPSEAVPPLPILRVMTFNIAHGRGLSFQQAFLRRDTIATNLDDVAKVIAREAPDVVALQETDGPSVWSGHFDHVDSLGRAARYPHAFRGHHGTGLWPFQLDYGTALLSRLPLTGSTSQVFDQSWRDNKGFVVSTVRAPGFGDVDVDVVSVHLDFMRAEVRSRQIEEMIRVLSARDRPLVVLGDLNCDWSETTCVPRLAAALGLRAHSPQSGERTFSSESPDRRIDWILVSEEMVFRDYRTLSDRVSDHRAVIAEIEWLPGG